MKTVNLRSLKSKKAKTLALNESKFLRLLSHPNIIKYYNSFGEQDEGDYLYVVEEFCENGDMTHLLEVFKENDSFIPERDLWFIFLQCIQGLAYIHKVGAIHRDIKTENIFIDKNMKVKIGDFGASALMVNIKNNNENIKYLNESYLYLFDDKMMYHGTTVYTEDYKAPEIKKGSGYDQKIDVFSMGITFYEMCYQYNPNNWGFPEKAQAFYSKEMINLINEMTEKKEKERNF